MQISDCGRKDVIACVCGAFVSFFCVVPDFRFKCVLNCIRFSLIDCVCVFLCFRFLSLSVSLVGRTEQRS